MEEADGPGPHHDHHVVGLDRAPGLAGDAGRQRLGQREPLGGQVLMSDDEAARCDGLGGEVDVLRHPAVHAVPQDPRVAAEVVVVVAALPASPAGDDRSHDDRRAERVAEDSRADGGHVTRDLVAQDDGWLDAGGLLAAQDPQIGAAQRVRADRHQHFSGTRRGRRDLRGVEVVRTAHHGREHRGEATRRELSGRGGWDGY
jgi:hypothetical protein